MAINFKKYFKQLLAAIAALFKGAATTPVPAEDPVEEPAVPAVTRPVLPNGRTVGCSCYNLLYATGDREAWLKKIYSLGATKARFFLEASWAILKDAISAPYVYRGGTFHLDEKNAAWWSELERVLRWMKAIGIRAHIVAFDYCSRKRNTAELRLNPFFNNTVVPQNAAAPGFLDARLMPYYKGFLADLVALCKGVGVDFEIEPENEYYWLGYNYKEADAARPSGYAWHKTLCEYLVSLGVPKSQILTSIKWDLDMDVLMEMAKDAGVYVFHGAGGRQGEIIWNAVAKMKAAADVELSGDGVFEDNGPADNEGHRGASEDEMRYIAKHMLIHGVKRYEYFDRGMSDKTTESSRTTCGVITNVDLFHPGPLTAIVAALGGK
jgi:hypothetical protein